MSEIHYRPFTKRLETFPLPPQDEEGYVFLKYAPWHVELRSCNSPQDLSVVKAWTTQEEIIEAFAQKREVVWNTRVSDIIYRPWPKDTPSFGHLAFITPAELWYTARLRGKYPEPKGNRV